MTCNGCSADLNADLARVVKDASNTFASMVMSTATAKRIARRKCWVCLRSDSAAVAENAETKKYMAGMNVDD